MTARGDRIDVVADVRVAGPGGLGAAEVVDVHLGDGRVLDVAPAGALPRRGLVLDAGGGWLVPGLWDHHVHVLQWALVTQREPLGAAESAAEAAAIMGRAAVLGDGRRVGTGFRDALWPDTPSLDLLDRQTGDVPTYLINADVHSVWLNSAALRREGMRSTNGLLRETPAFEVSRRLNLVDALTGDALVAQMAHEAAARGVVGIVDLDMAWNAESWRRRLAAGFDALRVEFGIYPDLLDRAVDEGLRSGQTLDGTDGDLVHVGPLKVITDGSLGTRTAACSHPYPGDPHDLGMLTVDPADLTAWMTRAAGAGIECAIHAIGDVANAHALDAFAASGAWGRIEHAQLIAHADIPRFARLGVAASIQPEHAVDDRDLTDRLWRFQTALAYPLRSLVDAGATVLFGSDAPVSPLDPWAAIAAAVHRTRDGREPWHPEETVDVLTALTASSHRGASAAIEPGATADLVLCGSDPFGATEAGLRSMAVSATLLGGRVTHAG
ncbi:amidohydrolase family protein [Microbacterium awajiense]|uniref:Amidohydrolase family protein n=1 Tax=Microbacterium awajiense TaxID=415214 RepID=A0ABP7A7S4_9MICO